MHADLAHSARNQLRVLGTEIQYGDVAGERGLDCAGAVRDTPVRGVQKHFVRQPATGGRERRSVGAVALIGDYSCCGCSHKWPSAAGKI